MTTIKEKQKVAVDFDDVIVETIKAQVEWHNATYGTNLKYGRMTGSLEHMLGLTAEQTSKRWKWFMTEEHANIEPDPYAANALRTLSRKFELVLVTARSKKIKRETLALLDKHGMRAFFDEFHFLGDKRGPGYGVHTAKRERCREIGAIALIDDMPRHLEGLRELGIQGILRGRPWNKRCGSPDWERYNTWTGILNHPLFVA